MTIGEHASAIELSDRPIGKLVLRGATVDHADLTGLKIRDGFLGADIAGVVAGLKVNGFDIATLIWDETVRRDPARGLTRSTDLADLREAWSVISERWRATEEQARALGEAACNERVDGEWSVAETLRHLVFVIDAWIRRVVLGESTPYHRMALPPSFLPDLTGVGIDVNLHPGFDDILEARHEAQRVVDALLADLTQDGLSRICDQNPATGFPPSTTDPVLRCLHTLLNEEWSHHGYAVRDLEVLEQRS
jgi:uncharacterized damage-inducible protein DinB